MSRDFLAGFLIGSAVSTLVIALTVIVVNSICNRKGYR